MTPAIATSLTFLCNYSEMPVNGRVFECKRLQPIKNALNMQQQKKNMRSLRLRVEETLLQFLIFPFFSSLFHYFNFKIHILSSTSRWPAWSVGNNWQHSAAPLNLTLQTSTRIGVFLGCRDIWLIFILLSVNRRSSLRLCDILYTFVREKQNTHDKRSDQNKFVCRNFYLCGIPSIWFVWKCTQQRIWPKYVHRKWGNRIWARNRFARHCVIIFLSFSYFILCHFSDKHPSRIESTASSPVCK